MSGLRLEPAVTGDGVTLTPVRGRGVLGGLFSTATPPLDALPASEMSLSIAVADLRALAEETGEDLEIAPDRIRLSHALVARLDAETAERLGLPPLVDLRFETAVEGTLGDPGFLLSHRWTRGGRQIPTRRTGAILETDGGPRRIPATLLEAIRIAETFDPGAPLSAHWEALARFRQSLDPDRDTPAAGEGRAARVGMTEFLRGLRIDVTDAMSLSPREGPDGPDFDPVPFSREALAAAGRREESTEEADGVLSGAELAEFQRSFRGRGAALAYRLGDNRYLVADRSVRPALEVMARKQKAPAAERIAFLRNPRPALSEAIEAARRAEGAFEERTDAEIEAEIEAATDTAFVETREFSERVVGIGRWKPPELPMPERAATTWMPEAFDDRVRELLLASPLPELEALRTQIDEAIEDDLPEVAWKDVTLAATPATRAELDGLISMRRAAASGAGSGRDATDRNDPVIVQTTENFDDVAFAAQARQRRASAPAEIPATVATPLLDHQRDAFDWQVAAWSAGLPGILNADDQGLGKTLQTLSFLDWLRGEMAEARAPRRPLLIVAPTSLLENWEAEVEKHLAGDGLGTLVRLYGSALANRKRPGLRGKDTDDDGEERLDLDTLHTAIAEERGHNQWLLTTYTTLTNYHRSLALVPFAAAVFDEIQALKNPAALRSAAARAINADFTLGLTGTPIENRTTDLWAIMDQIAPGNLGPLSAFVETYGTPEESRMRELHGKVFGGEEGRPPLGQRRLKREVAKDLPDKRRLVHPRVMPRAQADRYDEARAQLLASSRGAHLKMLHHIRSVSVHPDLGADAAAAGFVEASARLTAAMEILQHVAARRERALVFIEDRRMQHRFAELVRQRFDLDRVDIINGETPTKRRMETVRRFQAHLDRDDRFDLLVLGPRAAGTGLTLTAATHVIHLSRWWNPAVEEQCNDRTHRIGQTHPVTIHVPLAIHPDHRSASFDCLLHELMQRKRQVASSVLWPAADTDDDVAGLEAGLAGGAEETGPADLTQEGVAAVISGVQGFQAPEPLGDGLFRLRTDHRDPLSLLLIASTDGGRSIEASRHLSTEDRSVIVLGGSPPTGGSRARNMGTPPVTRLDGQLLGLWPRYVLCEQG